MGIKHESRDVTIYEVLATEAPIEDSIVQTPVERLSAIPSTIDLAGAEIELVSLFSRELRLQKALEPLRDGRYEYVFLDCPPSLGLLTVNALAAAEELIVPIQCEYYALEGLGQLLRNVSLVQQNVNKRLRLTGIVMTMFDPRTKLSEQVVEEVKRYFGDQVYDTVIPRTVRLSEAPGYGEPITVYDSKSRGAETYRALAVEVADKPPPDKPTPMPLPQDIPDVIAPAPQRIRAERPPAPEAAEPPPPKPKKPAAEVPPEIEAVPETEPVPAPAKPVLEVVEDLPEPEPEPEPELQPQPVAQEEQAPETTFEVEDDAFEESTSFDATPSGASSGNEDLSADPEPEVEDLRDVESPLAGDTDSGAQEPKKKKWRMFRKGGDA